MSKFKVGDTLTAAESCGGLIIGHKYKVVLVNSYTNCLQVQGSTAFYHFDRFLPLKEELEFDMINEPWFIRVTNEKEFELAKEFIKSKGFEFAFGKDYNGNTFISNRDNKNEPLIKGLKFVMRTSNLNDSVKEIKLNFKTTLDSVEYPKVKSEQELEIEKIESEMQRLQAATRKLADRLNKIKGDHFVRVDCKT